MRRGRLIFATMALLSCTLPTFLAAQDSGAMQPAHNSSGGKLKDMPFPPAIPGMAPSGPAIPPQLLNSTETAIDQQSRGEFPTMERGPSLPLGSLQRSWDRPQAASGQTAPGIVHYLWQADFVMGVRTRDFMVTTLMLPSWEHVTEFYLGDPLVFEAKKVKPNVLAIRSRNAGADSNLTLLGSSGNLYNFYLRSEAWNTTQITDLAVYIEAPGSDEVVPPAADHAVDVPVPDYVRKIVRRPEDIRFDMKIYAAHPHDAEIAPQHVFEDGLFTYFDFGDKADSIARPVVHQMVDGVDSVVNTRTTGPHGAILVAEAVGDFTLRNGGRIVCVKRVPVGGTE
jgi:ComB9 competence protein